MIESIHIYMLTLISFLIYKEWLVLSIENKFRGDEIIEITQTLY